MKGHIYILSQMLLKYHVASKKTVTNCISITHTEVRRINHLTWLTSMLIESWDHVNHKTMRGYLNLTHSPLLPTANLSTLLNLNNHVHRSIQHTGLPFPGFLPSPTAVLMFQSYLLLKLTVNQQRHHVHNSDFQQLNY